MLLLLILLTGSVPFIRKGREALAGEIGFGMAVTMAFLLGAGYYMALLKLWSLTFYLPLIVLSAALAAVWIRRTFWRNLMRKISPFVQKYSLVSLLFSVAFLFLWYLACEKELPCGWDPAFHAILAKKILLNGTLSRDWMPFENVPMNYPQGSHVLIALTAEWGRITVPEAQKLLMFALILPSSLLIGGIACKAFRSLSAGYFSALTYTFLGNIGTYSSFWSWGGYPTAVGFLFFSAIVWFALNSGKAKWTDYAAAVVLWGAFGLCHHMTVVIAAVIMAGLLILYLFGTREGEWAMYRKLIYTGLGACLLFLPCVIFQIAVSGTATDAFRLDDAPFTFFSTLENGSFPLIWGLPMMIILLFAFRKTPSSPAVRFLFVWAITTFGAFFVLDVLFRNLIAIPFYGESFTFLIPSRFLTMSTLPLSIFAGSVTGIALHAGKWKKRKNLWLILTGIAVLYGCWNFWSRSMGDAPSKDIMFLAEQVKNGTPENAYIIVDPSKISKTHWLPFLTWKSCITNPIPGSDDRRTVRQALQLFLYTEWEKMDLPAIRRFLADRDQKAYWIRTRENGEPPVIFQYPVP